MHYAHMNLACGQICDIYHIAFISTHMICVRTCATPCLYIQLYII